MNVNVLVYVGELLGSTQYLQLITILPVFYRHEAQCCHSRMISAFGREFDLFCYFCQLGF